MANTVKIKRNLEGVGVGIHLEGQAESGQGMNKTFSLFNITIGDLADGMATLSFGGAFGADSFVFTLDTHADDNGVNGATAHAELKNLLTHTTHEHGEKSNTIPLWKQGLNALGISIANIFGRLESVEKALAMDTKPFHRWIVRKGREFQCEMENRENGIASVVLPNNYIAVSAKLNDDPNDTRELLRIKTSLGVLQIITARQELGAIQDALRNDADEAVHSQAHLARMPETEGDG